MTENKKHSRKLGLSMVSLTKARPPRFDIEVATEIKDDLEPVLTSLGFFDDAPFKWVTIVIRYGVKDEDKPHYQRVNKKYGDLPLAIEVDTNEVLNASRNDLKRLLTSAVLKALIHAGKKYNRPVGRLENMLNELTGVSQ